MMSGASLLPYGFVLVVVAVVCVHPAQAEGILGEPLREKIAELQPGDLVAVIIRFTGTADLSSLAEMSVSQRRTAMQSLLHQHALTVQAAARDYLHERGAMRLKTLWFINALAATVPVAVVPELAKRPEVERVDLDAQVDLPAPISGRR